MIIISVYVMVGIMCPLLVVLIMPMLALVAIGIGTYVITTKQHEVAHAKASKSIILEHLWHLKM